MYDFGLTMLFAITGYKLERLPKTVEEREKKIRKLLNGCLGSYDEHLLGAISRMVGLPGHQLVTNKELRENLDGTEIQANIIKAESRAHSLQRSGASDRSLSQSKVQSPEKPGVNLIKPNTLLSNSEACTSKTDSFAFGVMSGSTIGTYKKDQRLCYSQAESSNSSFYQPWGAPRFKSQSKLREPGVVIYQKIDEKDEENA